MRIDLVTDRVADDRGRPRGPAPGPAEEIALRALIRELGHRGIEPVLAEPPAPGAAPAEPAEALLLAASARSMDASTLGHWLDASRAAASTGRRVVISGLALDERPLPGLAELLSGACFVGLRDEASRAAAARVRPGLPAACAGWDDALVLPQDLARPREGTGASPRIVAVLDHPSGPFGPEESVPATAVLLDALVHRTGASVTLAAAAGAERDARFCAAVAARLPEDVRRAVLPSEEAAEVLRSGAEFVVTTSREAVALALPVGSCVLPVAWDSYAEQGMQAVLDRWGLVKQVVPLAALLTPGEVAWDLRAVVQRWASEAVEGRAAVRAALLDAVPAVASASARWWDGVAEALRGRQPRDLPVRPLPPRGVGAAVARELRRRYVAPAATEPAGASADRADPAVRPPVVPPARASVAVVVLARGGAGAPGRAEGLRRLLDGVLRQTFTDWRLVVAGTEGDAGDLEAVLAASRHRFAGRDSVVRGRRALGPGAAVNLGLRAADSEFVLVVGGTADGPPWPATLLQRAVAHLEDPLSGDDGVVVRTGAPGREGGGAGRLPAGPGRRTDAGPAALTLVDLLHGDHGLPGPFLYRRAVHDVLGDYDETLTGAGEWEFALRFLGTFTVALLPGTGSVVPRRPPVGVPAQSGGDELVVRERHLKQWTAEHGIGLPLHLGRTVEEQAEALHRRLDDSEALARELLAVVRAQADRLEELERTVARRGLVAFCRRTWRALTGRGHDAPDGKGASHS